MKFQKGRINKSIRFIERDRERSTKFHQNDIRFTSCTNHFRFLTKQMDRKLNIYRENRKAKIVKEKKIFMCNKINQMIR